MHVIDSSSAITPSSGYGLHIDSTNDEDLTYIMVPLTTDLSIACDIPKDSNPFNSLPISIILSSSISHNSGIILGKDYRAMEPSTTFICTAFGK